VTKEVRQGDKKVIDGFETYLCVQNPNDQPIKVEAVCLTPCLPAEAGNTSYKYRFSVGANSRKTLVMNGEERSEEIPYDPANPVGFEDKEISVRLKSASPFIAERSLYWHNKTGGSDSIGYPTDKQLGDMDKIK